MGKSPRNWRTVYPRTGGGNSSCLPPPRLGVGLSPHGRGKRGAADDVRHHRRSIPARAGETNLYPLPHFNPGVYPRTGGGNQLPPAQFLAPLGLSPHGRGKPQEHRRLRLIERSIPARAGETGPAAFPARALAVYPRTGGGNLTNMDGRPTAEGLSPHGRGKLVEDYGYNRRIRSIPARAGETAIYGNTA